MAQVGGFLRRAALPQLGDSHPGFHRHRAGHFARCGRHPEHHRLGSGLSDLSGELGEAIAPLGIAFDTTLIALSLSVVLTFLQVGLQRREDNILGDFENWGAQRRGFEPQTVP